MMPETPKNDGTAELPRTLLPAAATAAAVWILLYSNLDALASMLVHAVGLTRADRAGESLHFLLYELPKVLLLLTAVVFVMGVVHTFVSPERTRQLLSQRRAGTGNGLAALLGMVTPFCSCSAVPLFIGFLQAGVPLGVTFSFLIAAPMVDGVALFLLLGMFGWQIALIYVLLGFLIAVVSGVIIERLHMEHSLEEWVQNLQQGVPPGQENRQAMSWNGRIREGLESVRSIVGKVWMYIVLGVGAGALIHGYVPETFMASLMGEEAWWSVPAAVLVGVPMYTNIAGVLPVAEALIGKGAAIGTVMAFMMSVIALSAPEMIILRKVLKPRLIAVFAGIVASGIIIVGFLFNLLL
ncbi:MAG: permease [Prosthecochloris sp.]|nr:MULTISPECIES: permease [Prosthecochloris]MEC9486826.1 permease [Prosthecochloris sp.]